MSTASNDNESLTQYNLTDKFRDDMLRLLTTGEGSDAQLTVDGISRSFLAHSTILAARCSALKQQIVSALENPDQGEIPFCISTTAVAENAMVQVLQYIYTGRIVVTDANIFDVLVLSVELGIVSLERLLLSHFEDVVNAAQLTAVLDNALSDSRVPHRVVAWLTRCVAERCSAILLVVPIEKLSEGFLLHLLEQEQLDVSEQFLWKRLVAWACHSASIVPAKPVAAMDAAQRRAVGERMARFCRPGLVRPLDLPATLFAREAEPLGVFAGRDALLKYRFDVLAETEEAMDAFAHDREQFLLRVRQRSVTVESDGHPAGGGGARRGAVRFPAWVSAVRVAFDARCSLGRYADLELFEDAGRGARVFSFSAWAATGSAVGTVVNRGFAKTMRVPAGGEALVFATNALWWSFYSPHNVGESTWGYKFTVSIAR